MLSNGNSRRATGLDSERDVAMTAVLRLLVGLSSSQNRNHARARSGETPRKNPALKAFTGLRRSLASKWLMKATIIDTGDTFVGRLRGLHAV